jgi:hypothetical protein
MIPCIFGGTAVHDPQHSCHFSRTGMAGTASMDGMSHDMAGMEHSAVDG